MALKGRGHLLNGRSRKGVSVFILHADYLQLKQTCPALDTTFGRSVQHEIGLCVQCERVQKNKR